MRLIDGDRLFAEIKERHDMFAGCEYIGDKARRDELGSFMADIVNAPTVNGWISVTDKLPQEGKTVLVARKFVEPGKREKRYVETAERIGLDWVSVEDEYNIYRQFHTQPYAWMALPEAPKEVCNNEI